MSSLREKVVIVGVQCGKPPLSKKDEENARRIDAAVGGDGSVEVRKTLIKKNLLKSIVAIETDFKTWQKSYVAPFDRAPRGCGIIMVENLTEWQNEFRRARREWEIEVDKFCNNYDEIINESKRTQGTNFDATDLPQSKEEMKSRFKFEMVQPYALENPEDLRFALNANEIKEIEDRVASDIMSSVEASLKKSFEAVKHFNEMLSDYEDNKGTKGRKYGDPALENVRKAADELSNLNFTGNEGIEEIQRKMRELVDGHTAKETKEDNHLRDTLVSDSKTLMERNFAAFGY